MNNNISKKILESICNFIERKFGLYFTEERFNDVVRALNNASKQKSVTIEEYIDLILLNRLSQNDLIQLAACLTIGETYFFRDRNLFKIVKEKLLLDIINRKKYSNRSLKIWSAGCSSGEEPYSIAILIKELIPDYKNWDIKIIATDINENSLNKARSGIYSEWSFRGMDLNFKKRYFTALENKHYKLNDEIMKLVMFYNLNLANDIYLVDNQIINNVDIIFCRNVLMYFSENIAYEIIKKFYNIIIDGGWLIGAPTENLYFNETSFVPVNIEGTFLYSKGSKQTEGIKPNKEYVQPLIYEEIIAKPSMEEVVTTEIPKKIPKEVPNKGTMERKDFEALCRSSANEGKLEEALEWCKKAISKDRINPVYYQLLANIEQELGNIDEAIDALKKAIFLDPNFIIAYFDLANLKLKQQKYRDAFKNFENVRLLLKSFEEEDIIPYSEELTAGMLKQIIDNISYEG